MSHASDPMQSHRNRGFVEVRKDGFRIDRRRKLSSIVPNEIILVEMQRFFEEHFSGGRGGRLLDVGAGLKPYAVVYEKFFAECISVDHAHSQHDIEVDIIGSAESLPVPDQSFDCVLCTEVLEHCGDPDAAMSEMARVLRPGGYIFLTTPFLVSLHEMPYDYYRYTPSALRLMATDAGLVVDSIVTKGDYLAVLNAMLQFPWTKGWHALSKLLKVRLFDPRNPIVLATIVWPQLLYLAYWRRARASQGGIAGRVYRKLEYITLGYVTVLHRP